MTKRRWREVASIAVGWGGGMERVPPTVKMHGLLSYSYSMLRTEMLPWGPSNQSFFWWLHPVPRLAPESGRIRNQQKRESGFNRKRETSSAKNLTPDSAKNVNPDSEKTWIRIQKKVKKWIRIQKKTWIGIQQKTRIRIQQKRESFCKNVNPDLVKKVIPNSAKNVNPDSQNCYIFAFLTIANHWS
jgi:hypothetical protein